MTTPIYQFPYPALGANADGPAAFQGIATRVEREMTTIRAAGSQSSGPGFIVGPGQGGTAVTWAVNLNTIGWVEVEVGIALAGNNVALPGAWAGFLTLALDGVNTVSKRYHNANATQFVLSSFSAKRAVTAAQTSMTVSVVVQLDAPSAQPVVVQYIDLAAWQFGAPSTG